MSLIPTRKTINGTGLPRVIREMANVLHTSSGNETYTSTTATDTVNLSSSILVNMRITSFLTVSEMQSKKVYAKITAIDLATNTLTIDEWVGGTPTNGQTFTIDGWIADLPRCQSMTETFSPDYLVHNLFRGKKTVKFFGWRYSCTLDYSQFMSGDTIYLMREHLRGILQTGTEQNLILIPRKDSPYFNYNVFFSNDISLTMHESKWGHKDIQLKFEGKENIASFPLFDGYGVGYSQLYGTQF